MKMKKGGSAIWRIAKYLLLLYLAFFLVSVLFPPARWKTAVANPEDFPAGESQERVLCVDDNREALIWRLRMINAAEQNIVLSTFDLRDDQSGQEIMAALLSAADRGVQIQILVDGMNGALSLRSSRNFRALVAMPNVEAKFYSPIDLLRPWRVNYRLHDKYLIIDDAAYLLGGRNTYDLFLGDYAETYNLDRDILVYAKDSGADSSLKQLSAYFEEIWALDANQSINVRETSTIKRAQQELRACGAALMDVFPETYQEIDWEAETIPANRVSLLSNAVTPENKAPQLWKDLCALMKNGSTVRIQTPYLICNQDMYWDLEAVCGSADQVQIMTNAVENGANPFGCSDYLSQKHRILDTGIEMVEWMGGQSMHTKTVLIDDAISVIGSFNLDMRSAYLDTELMLVIDCPALNQQLQAVFDAMAEQSRTVSPDGSETLGIRCEPMELPAWKRYLYGFLRVISQPVRYLL